jgi:Fe2+ transport system protein FeoA
VNGRLLLSELPAGARGRVTGFQGGREFQNRVISMGLNVGSDFEIIHTAGRRAGPVLVARGPTRLAIGHGMADKIEVAPIDGVS